MKGRRGEERREGPAPVRSGEEERPRGKLSGGEARGMSSEGWCMKKYLELERKGKEEEASVEERGGSTARVEEKEEHDGVS